MLYASDNVYILLDAMYAENKMCLSWRVYVSVCICIASYGRLARTKSRRMTLMKMVTGSLGSLFL